MYSRTSFNTGLTLRHEMLRPDRPHRLLFRSSARPFRHQVNLPPAASSTRHGDPTGSRLTHGSRSPTAAPSRRTSSSRRTACPRWPQAARTTSRSRRTRPTAGHADRAALRRVDAKRGCAVGWCDGRHYARSLCKRHARMAYAYGLDVQELVALVAPTRVRPLRPRGHQPEPTGRNRPRPHRRQGPRRHLRRLQHRHRHFDDNPDRPVRAPAYLRRVQR